MMIQNRLMLRPKPVSQDNDEFPIPIVPTIPRPVSQHNDEFLIIITSFLFVEVQLFIVEQYKS